MAFRKWTDFTQKEYVNTAKDSNLQEREKKQHDAEKFVQEAPEHPME